MYIPPHFVETDTGRVDALIEQNPFGMLITASEATPLASHIPFLRDEQELLCHLARANPQVKELESSPNVLCVFQGPHAYVSPSWYDSPGVPTWNYAVVHVYGEATLVDDETEIASHVERMIARFEAGFEKPWVPSYDSRLLASIVGIRIRATDIQGKFKLSQNRPVADRRRVIERLSADDSERSRATARLMTKISI